jgi:Tol biopolymer transport system component
MRGTRLWIGLLLAGLLAAAGPFSVPDAQAQYFRFGKNKVQYQTLDWHYLQSDHFDVYYYEPGGEALATFAARAAEEALAEVEALFDYRITSRIALLIYQSHHEFAVTNAASLPAYAEGIGGVTELFKNRVVLPFTGDYREFRRVLHHEIVHAVTNDAFYGGSVQRIIRSGSRLRLPLWFSEGIAEYSALGWDTHSDMYLREAVVNDRLYAIPELRGYFAYRGGQAVFDYLATQYGREKVTEVLQAVRAGGSVEGALRHTLGVGLDELSDRWHAAVRAVYYPEVAAREALDAIARPLAPAEYVGSFNTSAAISPQGNRVAFLSARGALFDVYVADVDGENRPRRLIQGQTTPEFESFPILTPGLSWNPQGTWLAVAVKAGEASAVALVDAATGRARHLRLPGLGAILSVRWSPDGSRLALSATRGAQTDLFALDLATETLTNLTDDVFSNLEPAWAPDGRSIVFHSDRGGHLMLRTHSAADFDMAAHDFGQFSLYRLDLDAPGVLERLTHDPDWDETSAAFGDDPNRLLFVSDRNGVPNLYELDLETGQQRPLTDLLTGVMQVSLSRDSRRAALVALRNGAPSVYLLRDPFEREIDGPLAPTVWAQRVLGENIERPAPALVVAHATTLEDNPFLREATSTAPFTADPMRRRRLPPDPLAAIEPPSELTSGTAVTGDTTVYGSVRVDLRNADASDEDDAPDPLAGYIVESVSGGHQLEPENNLREDGSFRPRRYRLRFSPDLIYGNIGYDALFGVQSVTQFSFSDLLGDHRLMATTNLVVDLRNADYLVSYQYLRRRTDYALTGFHLARQLTDFPRQAVYRYRNYGLVGSASYPLDKFRRVEADVSIQGVALTDLVDPTLRSRGRTFLLPAVSYTIDTTVPGYLSPAGGRRMAVRVSGSPGLSVAFGTVLADVRQYTAGSFGSLAFRASGGVSFGPDPQRFYAAGVQNWINPRFDGIPIRDENDFVFGTPVLPLRGHAFDAASGDRFLLLNAEARVPLVAALLPGPLPLLPLYHLHGVAFADAGTIYAGDFRFWRGYEDYVFEDVYVGLGVGLRTLVLGYPVRADWAWPFDGQRLGSHRFYLSVGLDF